MSRLIIYFRKRPRRDRFIPGDRFIIPILKNLFRPLKISGIDKVFINLCKSMRIIGQPYLVNVPFKKLKKSDRIIVLGEGRYCLEGYNQPNKLVVGIALMTHPSEWPTLPGDYPVAKYLQHSEWAKNVYVPYFGADRCETWFAGIDTERWTPTASEKKYDFLIYNKIRWDHEKYDKELRQPILEGLKDRGYSYTEIVYGKYQEAEYFDLLHQCRAMIFLCEHESQGFACCEAMSMNVPVFAWDQGKCLDPERFKWGDPVIPATSVPFFDRRCGLRFRNFEDFSSQLDQFAASAFSGNYAPRDYVVQNLSLKKSGERMMEILNSVYDA